MKVAPRLPALFPESSPWPQEGLKEFRKKAQSWFPCLVYLPSPARWSWIEQKWIPTGRIPSLSSCSTIATISSPGTGCFPVGSSSELYKGGGLEGELLQLRLSWGNRNRDSTLSWADTKHRPLLLVIVSWTGCGLKACRVDRCQKGLSFTF